MIEVIKWLPIKYLRYYNSDFAHDLVVFLINIWIIKESDIIFIIDVDIFFSYIIVALCYDLWRWLSSNMNFYL